MKQHTQTYVGPGEGYPSSGLVPGNCLQAAVASLLGLALDAVPHVGLFTDWPWALERWAAPWGWIVRQVPPEAAGTCTAALVVLWGPSPSGITHAVVGTPGGDLVWDPHPSRRGLARVRGLVEFLEAPKREEAPGAH